jgi:hypothetical protein
MHGAVDIQVTKMFSVSFIVAGEVRWSCEKKLDVWTLSQRKLA